MELRGQTVLNSKQTSLKWHIHESCWFEQINYIKKNKNKNLTKNTTTTTRRRIQSWHEYWPLTAIVTAVLGAPNVQNFLPLKMTQQQPGKQHTDIKMKYKSLLTVKNVFVCFIFRTASSFIFYIIFFTVAKHINVGRLFRNIQPSLQYTFIHNRLFKIMFYWPIQNMSFQFNMK